MRPSTLQPAAETSDGEIRYKLSRHVMIRPGTDCFVVESPLMARTLAVSSPAMLKLLCALTRPVRLYELARVVGEEKHAGIYAFVRKCCALGLLTKVDDNQRSEEDMGSLSHWEPHDLLFHTQSRLGRQKQPVGATYRFGNIVPEEPAIKAADSAPQLITLPKPDLETLKLTDVPLTVVLESRRSRHGFIPVEINTLGEFLYRTCRVTDLQNVGDQTLVKKVYPSAGSLHPLEIYFIWGPSCVGLNPGLYHYRALEHAVACVRPLDEPVQKFLSDARGAAGGLTENPPVLFVISARFRRTAWKYESIAYRVILAELGALYQTMYLVATAMRLAPCALGCGDSDHFGRVVGSDYYLECSVGEFMLGGAE